MDTNRYTPSPAKNLYNPQPPGVLWIDKVDQNRVTRGEEPPGVTWATGRYAKERVQKDIDLWVDLQEDPESAKAKLESTKYISRMLDMDPVFVFDNWEAVVEAMSGERMGYMTGWEAVKNSWEIGTKQNELGLLRYRQMTGDSSRELEEEIERLKSSIPRPDDVRRSPLITVGKAAAEMAPMTVEGLKLGARRGAVLAGSFAAVTAAATAGTVVGAPIAPLTAAGAAITGMTLGMTWGAAEHAVMVEAGLGYEEMIEDGVSPNIARWAGFGIGAINGAIEMVQIGSIPGVDRLLSKATGTAIKKVINTGSIKNLALRTGARFGTNLGSEASQEVAQESVNIVFAEVAKEIDKRVNGKTFTKTDAEKIKTRLLETLKQAALGIAPISGFGTITTAVADIRAKRSTESNRRAKADDVLDWIETVKRIDGDKEAAELAGRMKEQGHLTDEDIVRYAAKKSRETKRSGETAERQAPKKEKTKTYTAEEKEKLEARYTELKEKKAKTEDEIAEYAKVSDDLTKAERAEAFAEMMENVERPEWAMTLEEWEAVQQANRPERQQQADESVKITDRVKRTIAEHLPNIPAAAVEDAAMILELRAAARGTDRDTYVAERFVPGIFGEIPAGKGFSQGERAAVEFLQDGKSVIYTSENADFSSWVHELGHVFRQELTGEVLSTAEAWAGVVDGNWTVDQEEMFAKGFEQWLAEGKAPSPGMQSVFKRFAEWIRKVYGTLIQRGVRVNDQIRNVYESLLADPEAIRQRTAEPGEPGGSPSTETMFQESMAEEVKNTYRDTPQWMKAPNGKPTNLTEGQWALVRTPAFKEWFGDWEAAANDRMLHRPNTFEEAREILSESGPVTNIATNMEAIISKNNISKMTSQSAARKSVSGEVHRIAVANLPQLFEKAERGWIKEDRGNDPNIAAIHRFFAPLYYDGTGYLAKITVKEFKNPKGNRVYSVEALDIKKGPVGLSEVAAADKIDLMASPLTGPIQNILQNIENYNPKNTSKVVDENGAPLVVYHGTPDARFVEDSGTFETNLEKGAKIGMADKNAATGKRAYFFTSDKKTAASYSKDKQAFDYQNATPDVLPVYLALQNPMEIDAKGKGWGARGGAKTQEEQIAEAKQKGHDGIIVKNTKDTYNDTAKAPTADIYVAFSPEQIKSVYNKGTFGPETPNILYQESRHESIIRQAVEEGLPVPDRVLDQYADKEWAKKEIEYRSELKELAMDPQFDTMEDFISFNQAFEIEERHPTYYAEIWAGVREQRELSEIEKGLSHEESNRKWLESLHGNKPGEKIDTTQLSLYLENMARAGLRPDDVHPIVWSGALRAKGGRKLSEAHYKKIIDQLAFDPVKYRELFAELERDPEALQALEEELKNDPFAEKQERVKRELLELRDAVKDKSKKIEDLSLDLYNANARTDWALREHEKAVAEYQAFEKETKEAEREARRSAGQEAKLQKEEVEKAHKEALTSAGKEARLQKKEAVKQTSEKYRQKIKEEKAAKWEKVEQTKRYYTDMIERRRRQKKEKEYAQTMLKRILKAPSAAIDLTFAKRIEDLQGTIRTSGKNRLIQLREDVRAWMEENPDKQVPEDLRKLLETKHVSELTIEELEVLDARIMVLRDAGRRQRATKLEQKKQQRERLLTTAIKTILGPSGSILEYEALDSKETKKLLEKQDKKKLSALLLHPERLIDALDGTKNFTGPLHEFFWNGINDAVGNALRERGKRIGAFESLREKLGIDYNDLNREITVDGKTFTAQQAMFYYIGMRNERTALALVHGNRNPVERIEKLVKQLTPKEKQLADHIAVDFDENFERLRDAYAEDKNLELPKENNYVPMVRESENIGVFEQELADDLLTREGLKRSYAGFGGLKKRINIAPEHQAKIRTDLINLFLEAVDKQEHYISHWEWAKDAQYLLRDDMFQAAIRQQFGKEWNRTLQNWVDDSVNPTTYKAYNQMEQTIRFLRNNLALSALSFNVVTMLKQLPSVLLYLGEEGVTPVDLLASIKDMTGGERTDIIEFINNADPQVANRSMSMLQEEMKASNGSGYQQVITKVGQVGMKGIEMMDKLAVYTGWWATYQKAKRTMSEQDAITAARNATLRTQPAARTKDLAALYRTDSQLLRVLLQFSNQLHQLFNKAFYDIPAKIKNKQFADAMWSVLGYAAAAMVMGAIARKRPPEDLSEAGGDLVAQILNSTPLIGREIVSAYQGWGAGSLSIYQPLEDTVRAGLLAKKALQERDAEYAARAAGDLVEAFGRVTGLPTVSTKRLIRTFVNDWELQFDPWQLIGGGPEEKKQK